MLRTHLKITRETVDHKVEVVVDQPSRSYLRQFPSLMARQWAQVNDTCKDSAGQSMTTDTVMLPFHAASFGGYGRGLYVTDGSSIEVEMAADEQGIVIGTDAAAVQPDQYAMISQIRSGETAGKVMYCGTYVYGLTINATTDEAHFHVEAIFKNMSGGSINVNEVGIYANGDGNFDVFPAQQEYCILRDVIATIAFANNEYLRVQYTLSIAA